MTHLFYKFKCKLVTEDQVYDLRHKLSPSEMALMGFTAFGGRRVVVPEFEIVDNPKINWSDLAKALGRLPRKYSLT